MFLHRCITLLILLFCATLINAEIIEIYGDSTSCINPYSSSCDITFFSNTYNTTETLSISSTGNWHTSISSITGRSGSTCEHSNGLLTLTTSTTSNLILCTFIFQPYIALPSIRIDQTSNLVLPTVSYYPQLPILIPNNPTLCSNPRNNEPCQGIMKIPTISLPLTIETTSLLVFNSCTIDSSHGFGISTTSQPIHQDSTITLYTTLLQKTLQENETFLPDMITCSITITKSIISPYFHIISNSVLLTQFSHVQFADVMVYGTDSTCRNPLSSTCLLKFEFPKEIEITDTIEIKFSTYFTYIPKTRLTICPSTELIPRGNEHYILYCQLFQKPFHITAQRVLILNDLITITIRGEYIAANIAFSIQDIQFFTPLTVQWDYAECQNPNSPTCTAIVTSSYTGPPITLEINRFPFEYLDSTVICSDSTMGIADQKLSFPSRTDAVISPNQWIERINNQPTTCEISLILKYDYVYNNTIEPPSGLLVAFTQYPSISLRSKDFRQVPSFVIPQLDEVKFTHFPITTTVSDNCANPLMINCTMSFHVSYDSSSLYTTFRSFDVAIEGLDYFYAINYGGYDAIATGFTFMSFTTSIQEKTQTDTFIIPTTHYVRFEINSNLNSSLFFTDITQPATISITFRKESNIDKDIIPVFIHYANAIVYNQPPITRILPPTQQNGFRLAFKIPTLPIFLPNCFAPTSIFCTVHIYHWDKSDPLSYFALLTSAQGEWSTVNPSAFRREDYSTFPLQFISVSDIPGGQLAAIDWRVLLSDPLDPLPDYSIVHVLKPIGEQVIVQLNVFSLAPVTNDIIAMWPFTAITSLKFDGFPTFFQDCDQFNQATCTVNYIINNPIPAKENDIPWVILEHSLPPGIVQHLLPQNVPSLSMQERMIIPTLTNFTTSIKCTNILETDSFITMTLLRITETTPYYDTPFGHRLTVDTIHIYNDNTTPITQANPLLPIICTVKYAINNFISKARHRVTPTVMHNQVFYTNTKQAIFLPQMGFTPITLTNDKTCTSQQPNSPRNICIIRADFYGSDLYPLTRLHYTTAADYQRHPLIASNRVYDYYTIPIMPWELEANPSQYQHLYVGSLSLLPTEGGPTGSFTFSYRPAEQYKNRHSYGYVIFVNNKGIYPPQLTIATPDIGIPMTVNNGIQPVIAWFYIPAMVYGNLIKMKFNQTRFTTPGVTITTIQYFANITTSTYETDFGFRSLTPCIETTSALFNPQEFINYDHWNHIITLPTPMEQMIYFNTLITNTTIIDPTLKDTRVPQIVGWFMPNVIGTTQQHPQSEIVTIYNTKYVPNTSLFAGPLALPTGVIGKKCMFYIPITKEFPTHRNEVEQSMNLLGYGPTNYYAHHNFPYIAATSRLTTTSIDTTSSTTIL